MKSLITYLLISVFCAACATQQPTQQDLQELQKQREKQEYERAKKGVPSPQDQTEQSLRKARFQFDLEDGADFILQLLIKH